MDFELQFLKSGKALCGKVFPQFVATWNWLVNFCSNMKGDADVNDAQGKITIDRADPAHPIIRCSGCSGGSGGSGGGSGGGGGSGSDTTTTAGVTSVNSADGALSVIGGENIVVSTDGKTIKITYDEDKDEPDADPNAETKDPCDHDESGNNGGVSSKDEEDDGGSSGGLSGWGDGEGGVAAGGDSHTGDNECTTCPSTGGTAE